MTTQKFYSATVDGTEVFGFVEGLSFHYLKKSNHDGWIRYRDDVSDFTDLTEVEFHAKGTGVWIEGVTEPRLLRLLNLAVLHVPLDKFEDDWKLLGSLARNLNDKLIAERDAQFTPTEPSDPGKCCGHGDHAVDKHAIGCVFDMYGKKTMHRSALLTSRTPQLTPPMSEPKEFGAVVEASMYSSAGKRQRFVHAGDGLWIGENSVTKYTLGWSDLINPRIIEEEK